MHKTLFLLFFLISLVLCSCSSTKSLTNCPSFKKSATSKKWVKISKSKNNKNTRPKELLVAKEPNRKTRKIDRLANRLAKKIEKSKNNRLNIDTLNKNHLHVLLKELSIKNPSNDLLTMESGLLMDSGIEMATILQPKDKAEKLNNSSLVLGSNINPTEVSINSIQKKKLKKNTVRRARKSNHKKVHGLAIAAFICAVTGLGLFALIFGAFAVDRIEEEPEKYKGKTLAIVASILGLIGVILAIGIFGMIVSAP